MNVSSQELVARPDQVPAETLPPAATILQIIERAALNPDVDVAKMERLLDMAERVKAREAEQAFAVAMNAAQAEVRQVLTDSDNDQTRSRYASYPALDRAVRPIYIKHGFSLSFDTEETQKPDVVRVVCLVAHVGGGKHLYRIDMPADGKGAKGGDVMTKTHATGAATQYGMRYLVKMIFNVAISDGTDDDGNGASIEYISEKEARDLEAWADELKADKKQFLAFLKVQSFALIPKKQYQQACAALRAKKEANARGAK